MSDLTNLLNSETKTLSEYLNISSGIYEIPFSQRKYEWDKQQVNRLWEDLVSLYDGAEDEHLLNFFTLSKSENQSNTYSIYDGQQRTVTCLLILAIISQKLNLFHDNAADRAMKGIQDQFLVSTDPFNASTDSIYKVQFDDNTDSEFFRKITNENYDFEQSTVDVKDLDSNSSKSSILANYKLINQYVNSFIKDHANENPQTLLIDFCSTMINKCYLVVLIAYNEEIAARMFESLNNTGKDLEKYYVLKNDMVRYLGEDSVKDSWGKIDFHLSNLNHNDFLKNFATVENGKTTKANVLDSIYDSFGIDSKGNNSKEPGKQLIELLVQASQCYMAIINPSKFSDSNSYETVRFRRLSSYLKDLGFKQHTPIVLSMMMKNYSASEINRVLWAIIVLDVRNFYLSGDKSNTVENAFANYAKEIFADNLDIDSLVNNIYQFAKSDASLRPNIISRKVAYTANKPVKAFLTIIYNKMLRDGETEISPDSVDLEHILPKNPKDGSNWLADFHSSKNREKYTYKLGNLTLWIRGKNRSNKNADFNVKREHYKDSPLEENQLIAQKEQWTPQDIDDRTAALADKILTVFSVK